MNERVHRYRIWELAKENPTYKAEPSTAIQVDEFAAMMALYDYRPLVEVQLPGTCSRPNGPALECKTTTIGPDAVDLVYDTPLGQGAEGAERPSQDLPEGADVQIHLDKIGELAGVVTVKKPEGFQVAVDERYKPAVRDKLTYMAAEHAVAVDRGTAAQSPITKIEPCINKCSFLDHTGTLRDGTLVSISPLEALIRARVIPPLKSRIVLRRTRQHPAEVMRVFEIAFAVKFFNPLP
ncbi:MAG: hypothetical protein AB1508_03440 [Pseudomonadota bacterium]